MIPRSKMLSFACEAGRNCPVRKTNGSVTVRSHYCERIAFIPELHKPGDAFGANLIGREIRPANHIELAVCAALENRKKTFMSRRSSVEHRFPMNDTPQKRLSSRKGHRPWS